MTLKPFRDFVRGRFRTHPFFLAGLRRLWFWNLLDVQKESRLCLYIMMVRRSNIWYGKWFHWLYLYSKRADCVSFQKITFAGHCVACKQNTYCFSYVNKGKLHHSHHAIWYSLWYILHVWMFETIILYEYLCRSLGRVGVGCVVHLWPTCSLTKELLY